MIRALLICLLLGWTSTAVSREAREFTFANANRLYPNLEVRVAPVTWGPLRIRLSAPRADLRVSGHRLRLTPLPDGSHRAWGEVTFSAAGTLVADVEAMGLETRQEDHVVLPRQTRSTEGRVRIVREREAYAVTALEVPAEVRVSVRSRLAVELTGWCEGIPGITLLGVDCSGLERALSSVALPLPRPGETHRVPYAELSPEERRALDAYLEQAGGR